MASKFCLVLLLASSLAFLLVANATIIRTTVSEVEEENSRFGEESCGLKKLRDSGLNRCRKCMEESGSRDGYEMGRPIRSFQCQNECCGMMEEMGRDCMCQALKSMWSQCQSPLSRGRSEKMMCDREMMSKMMEMPRMCGGDKACEHSWILV